MTVKIGAFAATVTPEPEKKTVTLALTAPGVEMVFTMENDGAKDLIAGLVTAIARNEGMGNGG